MLLNLYNDLKLASSVNVIMRADALPEAKRPEACIGCGQCAAACPQHIDVPAALGDFAARLAELPTWAQICRKREEAANSAK